MAILVWAYQLDASVLQHEELISKAWLTKCKLHHFQHRGFETRVAEETIFQNTKQPITFWFKIIMGVVSHIICDSFLNLLSAFTFLSLLRLQLDKEGIAVSGPSFHDAFVIGNDDIFGQSLVSRRGASKYATLLPVLAKQN